MISIIGIDNSGSTKYCNHYLDYLKNVHDEHFNVFYTWNIRCCKYDTYSNLIDTFKSYGGTRLSTFVKKIKKDYEHENIKMLYIITDGDIDASDIKMSKKIIDTLNIESFKLDVLDDDIDISILKPFQNIKELELLIKGNSTYTNYNKFDFSKMTIYNYETYFQDFLIYVQVDNIFNKANLIDQRQSFIKHCMILKNQFSINGDDDLSFYDKCKRNTLKLVKNDMLSFELLYNQMLAKIDNLKNVKSYKINTDDIKKYKMEMKEEKKCDLEVKDIEISNYETVNTYNHILFEEQSQSILPISKIDILSHIKNSKLRIINMCPLYILEYKKILDIIKKELFGKSVDLETFKACNDSYRDPHTNKDIIGCLLFGELNNESIDNYNDSLICNTILNSKIIGNLDLWYYVLFSILKEIKWFEKTDLESFEKYVKYRLLKCKVLVGFKLDFKSNIVNCIDYILDYNNKILDNIDNGEHLNVFYEHLYIISYLIDIYKIVSPEKTINELVNKRVEMYKVFDILKRSENKYKTLISLLFKQVKYYGCSFPIDEENDNKILTSKDILYLYNIKHPSEIPYNLEYEYSDKMMASFQFFNKPIKVGLPNISKTTNRPFYYPEDKNISFNWTSEYMKKHISVDCMLSEDNLIFLYGKINTMDYTKTFSFFKLINSTHVFNSIESFLKYISKKYNNMIFNKKLLKTIISGKGYLDSRINKYQNSIIRSIDERLE